MFWHVFIKFYLNCMPFGSVWLLSVWIAGGHIALLYDFRKNLTNSLVCCDTPEILVQQQKEKQDQTQPDPTTYARITVKKSNKFQIFAKSTHIFSPCLLFASFVLYGLAFTSVSLWYGDTHTHRYILFFTSHCSHCKMFILLKSN